MEPNSTIGEHAYKDFSIRQLLTKLRRSQVFRMTRYSRFLLRSIFDTFIRPPLVLFAIYKSGLLPLPRSWAWSGALYLLSIPISEAILSILSSRRKRGECARLGAVPIPKVKGKSFGNADILRQLIAAEDSEYPGDIFLKWAKEYGPTYDMNILWASQIVTSERKPRSKRVHITNGTPTVDPENIKFVLSTGFASFEKGEKFHDMLESFWGEGILTTDGDTWKMHRTNARPFFAYDRLSDFATFERHAQKLVDIMDQMAANSQRFDLQVSAVRILCTVS
jgi:hypothetical protein